jgi:hypothetical protein
MSAIIKTHQLLQFPILLLKTLKKLKLIKKAKTQYLLKRNRTFFQILQQLQILQTLQQRVNQMLVQPTQHFYNLVILIPQQLLVMLSPKIKTYQLLFQT